MPWSLISDQKTSLAQPASDDGGGYILIHTLLLITKLGIARSASPAASSSGAPVPEKEQPKETLAQFVDRAKRFVAVRTRLANSFEICDSNHLI